MQKQNQSAQKNRLKNLAIYGMISICSAMATPDPNFHIYIAYGQSNMAGAGDIRDEIDNVEHPRYKMFATTACNGVFHPTGLANGSSINRPVVGEIYPAIPPMFHCNEGLSIADWFGRYLADSLPDVTIGIIPVAVGGTKIELFDKDKYDTYLSGEANWLVSWAKDYGPTGNAHARIVEVAKKAMEVGVIKGFIFHQGESGAMDGNDWKKEVKKTRDDILTALNLSADTIPFLAGEMEDAEAGGCCYGFALNQVAALPDIMENTYVVKSTGLKGNGKDAYHFSSESYQEFGLRYAEMMLRHANIKPVIPVPQKPFKGKAFEIPGKIEAEDFDIPGVGDGNDSYYDKDSKNRGDSDYRKETGVDIYQKSFGIVVGYNQKDEWLEYSVHAKKTGTYKMTAFVASNNDSAGFKLSVNGADISDAIKVPKSVINDGEFDSFDLVSNKVKLDSGYHVLRLTITGDWMDIDYMAFDIDDASTDSTSAIHRTRQTAKKQAKACIYKNGNFFVENRGKKFDLMGVQIE